MAVECDSWTGAQHPLDWALVYYLPYSNNLSSCASPILRSLTEGLIDSDGSATGHVGVFVQLKRRGDKRMTRYVGRSDTGEGFRMISAADDCRDSAAEAAFNRCVVDAEATFSGARNWCVAVLGHGGSPDQVCPDDDPGPDGDDPDADGLRWMPITGVAKAVAGLHVRTGGGVRLLYMQNCCKSTLHMVLAAGDCADALLASPLVLGAPNAYYRDTVRALRAEPAMDGLSLARCITAAEDPAQFGILACFQLTRAAPFFAALENFLGLAAAAVAAGGAKKVLQASIALAVERWRLSRVDYYAGGAYDTYVDAGAFCRGILALVEEVWRPPAEAGAAADAVPKNDTVVEAGSGPLSTMKGAHAAFEDAFRELLVFRVGGAGGSGYKEAEMCGLTLAFPLVVGKVGRKDFTPFDSYERASLMALEARGAPSLTRLRSELRAAIEANSDELREDHERIVVQAAATKRTSRA